MYLERIFIGSNMCRIKNICFGNQKKQGREVKEKRRGGGNWKENSNKKKKPLKNILMVEIVKNIKNESRYIYD
jgi:hypothetical protein